MNVVLNTYNNLKRNVRNFFIEDKVNDVFQVLSYGQNGSVALVNTKTALTISTVFSCVELIIETCSLVPIKIYIDGAMGKTIDPEHPSNVLLKKRANSRQSYLEFDQEFTKNYQIFGKAYAEIIRDRAGNAIELINLDNSKVKEVNIDGNLLIVVMDEKGERAIKSENVYMIGSPLGSKISQNRGTITRSKILDKYSDEMYESGGQMTGYVYGDQPLDKDAAEYLRTKFEEQKRNKSVGILPRGFKFEQLKFNLPLADANLIASKKYNAEDICRIFRIPLSLMNLSETADNKSEVQYNTFLTTVITPICQLKAAELNLKVFKPSETKHFVKHELKGLMRVNHLERFNAYNQAIMAGFMCPDEVRAAEDMNPLPNNEGEKTYRPLNMVPADKWGLEINQN